MNLIGTLIKECDIDSYDSDLTMVKKASLFCKDGIIFIKHYSTIIFAYDPKTKRCECDYDCSMTSNRQIRYALLHFDIDSDSVINIHEGSKMNHSGSLGGNY